MHTARPDPDIRCEALAAGASTFIDKTAAADELLVAVRRLWTESA